MPLSDKELIKKVRASVALLMEESFGPKYSISLPALCAGVEASLKETLKCFISATIESGVPQFIAKNAFEISEEVFYLDNIYRIRIVEDTVDPFLMNILILPPGVAPRSARRSSKRRIVGNGRFSRLAIHTSNQLEKYDSMFGVLAKTTFEAGYSWLENRICESLANLHHPDRSSQSLAEDLGRFIRTSVGESLADRIWFMVSAADSSMLAMDARKLRYSMNILAKERRRHGRSPLEQLVALATTVLPFGQTLTYKALQEDGSLRSRFLDAPYARPATPFMHALRTTFESEVASVTVIAPDSELIIAMGCPDTLAHEVKRYLPEIREGIQRLIRGRAPDFRESLRIANFHSTTATLRFEAAEVAGAFKSSLNSRLSANPKLVFISYSHADESHKDNIVKHLSPLVRSRQLEVFSDRGIQPGSRWDSEISEHLQKSNIILVLLSADFIASDYCYEKELSNALQRHKGGEAVVIPVFLRPCHRKSLENLAISDIQGVPKDGLPIERLQFQEDGYIQVVEAVYDALSLEKL